MGRGAGRRQRVLEAFLRAREVDDALSMDVLHAWEKGVISFPDAMRALKQIASGEKPRVRIISAREAEELREEIRLRRLRYQRAYDMTREIIREYGMNAHTLDRLVGVWAAIVAEGMPPKEAERMLARARAELEKMRRNRD